MVRIQPALLLLAAAVAVLAGPAGVPAEVVSLNEAGIRELTARRAAAAVKAFEAAALELPDNRTLQRNLAAGLASMAELARKAEDPLRAVRLLDRAIDLHPKRLRYRVLRGRARYESTYGAYRFFARQDFAYVLARDPDHLDALVNLGQIAYAERRLEEAVTLWRRAAGLRPEDGDVRKRLEKAERERAVERAYQELRSPKFVVRYSPSIPRRLAETVLTICETAYNDLAARFQHWPEGATVVTLYAPEEFRSATRVHGWVAGLSDGTIRLTVRPRDRAATLRPTLYHEYTHHLVRAIAPHTPEWLHEGLAQMSEGRSRAAADARLRGGGELELRLLSEGILRQSDPRRVSQLYDLALSFTHFLRDRTGFAGIQQLLRLLAETDELSALQRVYGLSRDELFAAWRRQLRAG